MGRETIKELLEVFEEAADKVVDCRRITEEGMDYLFTCKPKSHPWIAEQVKYAHPDDSLQKTE